MYTTAHGESLFPETKYLLVPLDKEQQGEPDTAGAQPKESTFNPGRLSPHPLPLPSQKLLSVDFHGDPREDRAFDFMITSYDSFSSLTFS